MNKKDWIIEINNKTKTVEQYEQKLKKYFDTIKAQPDYNAPVTQGCYKKESKIRGVLSFLIKALIISCITIVIPLFLWVKQMFSGELGLVETINQIGMSYFKSLIPIFIICFIVCLFLCLGLKFLSIILQEQTLNKLEKQIVPIMKLIPPNYRNSDKMRLVGMVYYEDENIPIEDIFNVIDEVKGQINIKSPFRAVMYDLPCELTFNTPQNSETTQEHTQQEEIQPEEPTNPYLPQDIDTKVYAGSENADKDLEKMIGLQDVKDQIVKLKNRIEFYGNENNNGCNMTFLGSAGTGKTSVARIITKILYDLGYIQENRYIEISGDYLLNGNRTNAVVEYSFGGVLFIDEAYLMEETDVIGVLLKAMEDHRKDFVVILAGYEEQMNKLFAKNEGFASRIKHYIYFHDYTIDEMVDIFKFFISNYNGKHYSINDTTLLKQVFELEKKSKSFGNARTVRNAVDSIMDNYADRNIANKTDTGIITNEDVQKYYESRQKVIQHEIQNSAATSQLDESIIRLSELKQRLKEGASDPDTVLNSAIGLDTLKPEIEILKNEKEFYNTTTIPKILLLGKNANDTLLQIITGYLYKFKYIQENKYLDMQSEFLKGSYVGHTAKRAEAIMDYATGGVIVIRNYNMLCNSDDSFASEAISAIQEALRKEIVIILVDENSQYIESIINEFTIVYEIPTMSNEDLLRTFELEARAKQFVIEEPLRIRVWNYICTHSLDELGIKRLLDKIVRHHISNLTDENKKYILEESDFVEQPKPTKLKLNI